MFENDIVQVGALSKAMVYATHFNTSVSTTLNKSEMQIKQIVIVTWNRVELHTRNMYMLIDVVVSNLIR